MKTGIMKLILSILLFYVSLLLLSCNNSGGGNTSLLPIVSIISPLNGQTGVSNTPVILLKFNEAVQNVNGTTVTLHKGSATGAIV
ncbi:MAG: hypothetical protein K0R94_1228, partial [Burkholderiales bacterium]|nr:hypothetical protein [Burkholderiales bacterium]